LKQALKLMRVAEQAIAAASRRMTPGMEADEVNVPLHRSAECLEFALAAAESYLAGHRPAATHPQRAD